LKALIFTIRSTAKRKRDRRRGNEVIGNERRPLRLLDARGKTWRSSLTAYSARFSLSDLQVRSTRAHDSECHRRGVSRSSDDVRQFFAFAAQLIVTTKSVSVGSTTPGARCHHAPRSRRGIGSLLTPIPLRGRLLCLAPWPWRGTRGVTVRRKRVSLSTGALTPLR